MGNSILLRKWSCISYSNDIDENGDMRDYNYGDNDKVSDNGVN